MDISEDAPPGVTDTSAPPADSSKAVSVVVPTYREAENLPALVERVSAALAGAGLDWEMLFVDDDSNDGSEAVVAELAHRHPVRIHVRRDPPRDLSLSVLAGLKLARHDRIVVMDADLSHPPERIPALLAALDEDDCDFAVGSRYVPGGSFDRAWSFWRFVNSRLATVLARPLTACSDPMSGFFALDRTNLPDPSTLNPTGYKIGLELMVRGRMRVGEIPIGFTDRDLGESKMNWRQQLKYMRHLQRLYVHRFGNVARMLFYAMVGTSGFVLDFTCYIVLQWLGLDHRLARSISFWPAVTWNWWLNRHITFDDRGRRPVRRQWAEFVASSLIGLVINVGSYLVLTGYFEFFDRYRVFTLFCGGVAGYVVNFLLANFRVYRQHHAPPAA